MNADALNLFLAVFSTLAFISLAALKPWLLMRPSFFVGGLMILLLSYPAVFVDDVATAASSGAVNYGGFSAIGELRALTILFPLFSLAWLGLSPGLNRRARRLYEESLEVGRSGLFSRLDYRAWLFLTILSVIYLFWFFSEVPLRRTGLWALVFDPANYTQARQSSGSELAQASLKYAQIIMQQTVLPALFILTWQIKTGGWKRGAKYFFLALLLLAASLTGAKLPAAIIIFAAGLAWLQLSGYRRPDRATRDYSGSL